MGVGFRMKNVVFFIDGLTIFAFVIKVITFYCVQTEDRYYYYLILVYVYCATLHKMYANMH